MSVVGEKVGAMELRMTTTTADGQSSPEKSRAFFNTRPPARKHDGLRYNSSRCNATHCGCRRRRKHDGLRYSGPSARLQSALNEV